MADTDTASDDIRAEVAASREAKDDDQPKAEENGKAENTDDIEAIASQADKPDAVKRALQAEREAAKEARQRVDELTAKVKEYEDRDKSEQEKLEERATSAEAKAKAAEAKLLRYTVAADKGLTPELAERLQGKTKKELEEDADRLLELVKPPSKPQGDADAGKGEGGEGQTFNDILRAKVYGP